jgi:hypothetical protein
MSRDGLDAAGSAPRAPSTPPRQTRRCRRRFRTTTTGRARTPSIGSCPCLAARAGSTSLVVHARCLTPHPVTRRRPCPRLEPKSHPAAPLPRQRLGWSPRAISRSSPTPRERCLLVAARKMRLTDFCNRRHSRALPDCPIPGAPSRVRLATCATRVPAHPRTAREGDPAGQGWVPADPLEE